MFIINNLWWPKQTALTRKLSKSFWSPNLHKNWMQTSNRDYRCKTFMHITSNFSLKAFQLSILRPPIKTKWLLLYRGGTSFQHLTSAQNINLLTRRFTFFKSFIVLLKRRFIFFKSFIISSNFTPLTYFYMIDFILCNHVWHKEKQLSIIRTISYWLTSNVGFHQLKIPLTRIISLFASRASRVTALYNSAKCMSCQSWTSRMNKRGLTSRNAWMKSNFHTRNYFLSQFTISSTTRRCLLVAAKGILSLPFSQRQPIYWPVITRGYRPSPTINRWTFTPYSWATLEQVKFQCVLGRSLIYIIPNCKFFNLCIGKSSAIQHASQNHLENLHLTSSVISKTTSSGLVKLLATQKRGIIVSPELCDILNKLLKSDEDNATGDIQLLCKLFSGERCSYHYSTEESRVIPQNTPFSILGSTQLQNAAKLIAKMDHGHGLVDRMLIATPLAYRPTLSEMERATQQLSTEVVEDFAEYFQNVSETAENIHFTLSENAKLMYRETIDQFAVEVNTAIQQGKVPPKSKIPELVPRVATALHVFNHTMTELLSGVPATAPPTEISNTTLESATQFVHHLESQKDILCQVSLRREIIALLLEYNNRLHYTIKTLRILRSLE